MEDKSLKWLRDECARLKAPTSGNKAELRKRIDNYRKHPLNSCLVKVPAVVPPLDNTPFADIPPYKEFEDPLRTELKWLNVVVAYNYFEKRNALNSYNAGRLLLQDRFLGNVSHAMVSSKIVQIRGLCAAEMTKQKRYYVMIEVCNDRCSITKATCECVAGEGLSAACKHTAALVCCIEIYVTTGTIIQNTSCTNALQVWHRPPKAAPKEHMYEPIGAMIERRKKRKNEDSNNAEISSPPTVDTTSLFVNITVGRGLNINAHENRRANVVGLGNDHDYCSKTLFEEALDRINFVDYDLARQIEKETLEQSQSALWHTVRKSRITASRIKDIITAIESSIKKDVPVNSRISSMNFESRNLSKVPAIAWGQDNEAKAFELFVNSYSGAKRFRKCGIFVDLERNHLAASPDGICCCQSEVLEIKCPYSDRSKDPASAHFLKNGELPVTHQYYYQCQFQMLVTKSEKCHFVVYTTKGIHVTVINFDKQFVETYLPKLEEFYKNVLSVEFVKKFGIPS